MSCPQTLCLSLITARVFLVRLAVFLAAFVLFLSPAMPNPDRNSDRNNTSTCYKAIIQFWRLSIANQGKSNIDKKNTCEPSKVVFQPLSQLYYRYVLHSQTQGRVWRQAILNLLGWFDIH